MAGNRHGIYGSEVATSIVPPTRISAGLPVVFGTAPVHLAPDPLKANEPFLCYTYAEGVERLGYSEDWGKYTLSEVLYSQFALFARAPVVFINVLDITKHKKTAEPATLELESGVIKIKAPVILSSLVVKLVEAGQPLTADIDYTAAYNNDEELIITALEGGRIDSDTESLFLTYDEVDASQVTKADIIGGVDITTGAYTGLELLDYIYSYFRLVPGLVAAPGYSGDSEVAAIMTAKVKNINTIFWCMALIDVPTDTIRKSSDVPNWKNQNNIVDPMQICLWPKVKLGERQYHLSTQAIGVITTTDSNNEDVPYWSPSNQSLQADGLVLTDGTEVIFDLTTANYLNGQGIVTGNNFANGWVLWGNRTAAYPSTTDPKDSFIPIRRMFNWINNTLITTYWSKIDNPMNKRLIRTIVDSTGMWFNGLTSRGFLLGGRVEFLREENPDTDLMDGIIRFHVYHAPPSPAEEIHFIQEYDPAYLSVLFETT